MINYKSLLPGAVIVSVICLSSFRLETPAETQKFYSIDQLPSSWKNNNSLKRALNIILPTAVKELRVSAACTDCSPDYSVALLFEKPIILEQSAKDIHNKRKSEGFAYECTTRYTFKSSLAVYNKQLGIAKVVITNLEDDEFVMTKKFNIVGSASPEKYLVDHASEFEPQESELLKEAEKRMYELRDQVEKLTKRH